MIADHFENEMESRIKGDFKYRAKITLEIFGWLLPLMIILIYCLDPVFDLIKLHLQGCYISGQMKVDAAIDIVVHLLIALFIRSSLNLINWFVGGF